MALRVETFDFDEEVARLEDELEELRNVLADVDPENPTAPELQELRATRETELQGVKWARDEAHDADYVPAWDEDVDAITLAGLTGGEVARVQDDLAADAGEGAKRVKFAAAGVPAPGDDDLPDHCDVDAPAPVADNSQSRDDREAVVSDLPHPFQVWVHARVEELTSVGGNGRLDYEQLREVVQENQ